MKKQQFLFIFLLIFLYFIIVINVEYSLYLKKVIKSKKEMTTHYFAIIRIKSGGI